jgi:hypothetical protein
MQPPLVLSIISVVVLSACALSETDNRFVTYSIGGFAVPGRLIDAKKTGFTECTADYYSYTCSRPIKAEAFGITPKKAYVVLNGADNFLHGVPTGFNGDVRDISPNDLSYREVILEFLPEDKNIKCDSKSHGVGPVDGCTGSNSVQGFMSNLRKAGWIETQWRSYVNFVRPGIPLEISVKPFDGQAVIRPEQSEIIQERIAKVNRDRRDESLAKTKSGSLMREMRSGN